jgi:hypothetical protein
VLADRPTVFLALTALGALAVAALSGCGADDSAPEPTSTSEGISASLFQHRSDVADRQAQVRIRNDGDEPVTVAGVEVSDARFDGVATRVAERVTTLPPGGRVDVRVQLPPVDCSAGDDATPTVALSLRTGGTQDTLVIDAGDPLDFLAPLHARECLAEELARVADVTIASFTPAPTGAAGALTLSVSPTGAGTAHLGAVDSTTLLTYELGAPAAPFPLDLDITPSSGPSTVEIPLVPQRCDPHVVQEDKRGTVFTIDATVGDVAGEIDLAAPADMKARILTWVAEWCRFGASG